jgi:hypothetical protein
MSRTTRVLAIGGLAAGLLIGGVGVASAATPAAPAKAWSPSELTTSQITDVKGWKKHWKGKRYGKRGWRHRHARRYGHHPRRYGYRDGLRGPRVGVHVGPRYRYRSWW